MGRTVPYFYLYIDNNVGQKGSSQRAFADEKQAVQYRKECFNAQKEAKHLVGTW